VQAAEKAQRLAVKEANAAARKRYVALHHPRPDSAAAAAHPGVAARQPRGAPRRMGQRRLPAEGRTGGLQRSWTWPLAACRFWAHGQLAAMACGDEHAAGWAGGGAARMNRARGDRPSTAASARQASRASAEAQLQGAAGHAVPHGGASAEAATRGGSRAGWQWHA